LESYRRSLEWRRKRIVWRLIERKFTLRCLTSLSFVVDSGREGTELVIRVSDEVEHDSGEERKRKRSRRRRREPFLKNVLREKAVEALKKVRGGEKGRISHHHQNNAPAFL
jgi:hypothetical protein